MAQAAIIFKDVGEDGQVDVGFEFPNIEEQKTMTPALYATSLLSFIIERGYHEQYNEEFEEMMEQQSGD